MLELSKVIAHRGASAYAPENTIASFNKAYELGSRFIEFDVLLTQDGEAFVFHDDKLKHKSNGRGEFGKVSSEYIQSLDAGRWFSKKFRGEKIPSLRDAIEWLTVNGVQANIEIKPFPGQTEQTTIAVIKHINELWPYDKPLPLVSSFDQKALKLYRSLCPEAPLGLLLHKWDKNWLKTARELDCYSVHFNKRALNKNRVLEVKNEGYKVGVYTVNRKRLAAKLFDWGVDSIFSDYPDILSW